jgi:hypothetical protein
MARPKAAQIYASLDAHVPPATLAADYADAARRGNLDLQLALELQIRQLAARYCHVTEYRDALARMERAKSRGKMGTSAPRMLQDIADQLEQLYAEGCYIVRDDGRLQFRAFTGGTPGQASPRPYLQITCENRPGAVALVCAKYRRGIGNSRSARYGTEMA